MVSYKGFEEKLKERGITRSDLTKELGISSRTIAKIGRGEKLSRVVMEKLCSFFPAQRGSFAVRSQTILSCKHSGRRKAQRSLAGFTTSCKYA